MIGTLTQAYVNVTWAGNNLSAYDDGAGGLQCLAQNVSLNLNKGESVPKCSFEISPNPIGFALFQELKASALAEPFVVTIGYPESKTTLVNSFRFAGLDMTTGHSPKLKITGVSALKGCWTDNKISYTMEEPITLAEFPAFLQEKAGTCAASLKFSFVGGAATEAATVEVKANQTQRTPHVILMDTLRPRGMDLQVGDSAFGGEVVISYTPNKEGETAEDQPTVQDGSQPATPGKRAVYIIGPGLMENISRSQKFTEGNTTTDRAASTTGSNLNEPEQTGVVQPGSAPQEDAANQETTTATKGKSNPSSAESGTVTPSGQDEAARVAFASILQSTCKLKVLMVPYMVGIKPRDLMVIPSLQGPGGFLEDWEVDDVSYSQDSVGGVYVSVSGKRTFSGEEPMLDSGTVSAVESLCAGLTTPALWNQFYWVQGPAADYPLAS